MIYILEMVKYVTTPDDWYPTFQGQTVRVRMVRLRAYGDSLGGIRVCVWGADDFGMEMDFKGDKALSRAAEKFEVINDGITQDALRSMGFVHA